MLELLVMIVTVAVVAGVNDPEVPITVNVNVEGGTRGERLKVNVEETEPPEVGVTGLELNDAVIPAGIPETLRVTGEENPLIELIITDDEADPPVLIVMGDCVKVNVGTETVRVVLPLMLPEVAVMAVVPGLKPVATPLALIGATSVSLLVKTTEFTVAPAVTGVEDVVVVPLPS